MGTQRVRFARQYRAALLDYLLGSGESGLERACRLGRRAIELDVGLLELLRVHQNSVNAVLESTTPVAESLQKLEAADEFLMETVSLFEMAYRGYLDLVEDERGRSRPEAKQVIPRYSWRMKSGRRPAP